MFEPDMLLPWPKATHCVPLGALIWKYIGPEPDDAELEGMLTDRAWLSLLYEANWAAVEAAVEEGLVMECLVNASILTEQRQTSSECGDSHIRYVDVDSECE